MKFLHMLREKLESSEFKILKKCDNLLQKDNHNLLEHPKLIDSLNALYQKNILILKQFNELKFNLSKSAHEIPAQIFE